MKVAVDKFGRILIPKKFRHRLGLIPGVELELVESVNGFSATILDNGMTVVRERGVMYVQGVEPFDVVQDLKAERAERGDKKAGIG